MCSYGLHVAGYTCIYRAVGAGAAGAAAAGPMFGAQKNKKKKQKKIAAGCPTLAISPQDCTRNDLRRSKILNFLIQICFLRPSYIIGRAGASPPSLTTGARRLYNIYIYIVRPTVLAPGWPRATRKRSRPDHTCKYIIRFYTCTYTRGGRTRPRDTLVN